ncbi:hypothetical protein [Neisseria sp. CCUG12390]|uniref:hypothetical protein n=1 Tax=Neisseria sp. CCUG12390 TaxID=3392035 RepID=UPI003A10070C
MFFKVLLPVTLAFSMSACVSIHAYTSPSHQKHPKSELKIPAQPFALRVEADFSRNGTPLPNVNPLLLANIEQSLKNSRVAVPMAQAEHTFKVSANNIANPRGAVGQGLATGLTLGMAGSTTQDGYEFVCRYADRNKILSSETYPHAIIATIGNTAPPSGLTVQSNLQTAFTQVTDDIVTNCLVDLQKKGYLLPE